jgi:hypothetical protein
MTIGNYISSENIYTAQGLREQVLDYTDWAGLYKTPTSFALFSAMGNITTVNNPKIKMNETTGFPRRAKATVDFTTVAAGSSGTIDLDTCTTNVLKNEYLAVGDMIRINGYDADDGDERESALIRIVEKNGTQLIYKTLHSTDGSNSTTWDISVQGGTYLHVTNAQDYTSSAPESKTIYPSQRDNWTQLYRFAYGVTEDMESSDKYFDATRLQNSREAEDRLYGAINADLMFSVAPLKPGADESGGVSGTGGEEGVMGGLPYLLGCDDLSASNTIYHSVAYAALDAANARTFIAGLYDWSDKFKSTGGLLYAITSKSMRAYIREAILYTGDVLTRGKVELPMLSFYYDEMDLGDIRIRLVVDDVVSSGSAPYITDGTVHVHTNLFMMALDMSTVGLGYRNRKDQGIMAPKNVPIGQIRNEYKYEAEWVAELTCAITRQDRNGVFFVSAAYT